MQEKMDKKEKWENNMREMEKSRNKKEAEKKSELTFIFVHGLTGWGSYDLLDQAMPYWGFFGGNVINYLKEEGYDCYGASVDPYGSAWDRACELYAQLAGKVVDYGAEHCSRSHHERFGKDYSTAPLIEDFDQARLVLVGHSFGGATVRLFSELLRNGSEEERAVTAPEELSDFFKGGNEDKIFALITLAAPTNGTTAYDLYDDVTFDESTVILPRDLDIRTWPKEGNWLKNHMKKNHKTKELWDYADYDMHIDHALALNSRISTFDNIYYFSYPCSSSIRNREGHIVPDLECTAEFFLVTAFYMSFYMGATAGGLRIGEEWQSNDGLVNEISARAPFGQVSEPYVEGMPVKTGIWYVMPTVKGDHMHLMGGVTFHTSVNIRPFFVKFLDDIINLDESK